MTTLIPPVGAADDTDGPVANARISHPNGIAIDSVGNLFVTAGYEIRKIGVDGIVSTVVRSENNGERDHYLRFRPLHQPGKVAFDHAGNMYVADDTLVEKISPSGKVTILAGRDRQSGSVDGVGEQARFSDPLALASDGFGNIYVADHDNSTIRKISPEE